MNEVKQNPLGTEKIGTLLRQFAVPSVIAMLVSALYNMVDQFFIGNSIGMLGNAATNVAFPLTTTSTALALLCGIGGAANFNISMGRKEPEKARRYMGAAFTMLLTLGIVLCVVARAFLEPMLTIFGATSDVMPYAMTYTGITSFGFPFLILTTGGTNLIRGDGSPKYSMMCNLMGAIINTILDPLFIFVFDWGMAGAAWATVLGQFVSGMMVLLYLPRFKTLKLGLSDFRLSKTYCLPIFALGLTPFFNQCAMMVVQVVLNNTMTHYGALSVYGSEIPLACSGIVAKVSMIFFSVVIGICQGMQPIVSFNFGAGNFKRVKDTVLLACKAAAAISIVAFLCFQLFPRQIIGFFGGGTEEYFAFAERYFRIYMFFICVNFLQPISSNFFTAVGMPKRGVFLSLTRQIIFLLPLLVVLPIFFGIDGAMYAAPIADFVAAVLALIFIRAQFKIMPNFNADDK